MPNTEYGTLAVRLYTAGGAFPVEGATVTISGADEWNTALHRSLISDRDGFVPSVQLPAPDRTLSMAPGAKSESFSKYDVEISKAGYYSKRIRDVPVFSGINATLPVNMIPKSAYDGTDALPDTETDALITENEDLE